jgi:hypothetical protein
MKKIAGIDMANDTLFVTRWLPEIKDVSGIISTTARAHAGTTLSDIFKDDPAYTRGNGTIRYGAIRKRIAEITAQQRSKAAQGLANESQLRPLRNDAGKIVDYRIMMDNQAKQDILRPDMEFQNVFAHMQSSLIDKQQTIINDKLTIDALVADQVDNMPQNPGIYTDMMDPESPYHGRYRKLPREVREYMDQYIGPDGTFMVKEDVINKVFGYQAWDLSNIGLLKSQSASTMKSAARLLHYTAKNATSYVKMLYVLATPAVILGNIFSNLTQLTVMQKIPATYVYKKYAEGIVEYARYREDTVSARTLLREIEAKQLPKDASTPQWQEYSKLVTRIQNNKLFRMSEAGLNSLIVEDVNTAASDGFINRITKSIKADKHLNKFGTKAPNTVGKLASTLFMTKGTTPGQATRQLVQLTDFVTRYVMIEYGTEVKGQDFKTAMHESIPAFILFDENLPPWLEALEGINLTMFVSFYLRAPRVAKKLLQTSPTGVATAAAIQYTTGQQSLGIINSTWMTGKFLPNNLQQGDSIEKMFGFPAIEFIKDILE